MPQSPSQIYAGLGVQTVRGTPGTLTTFPAISAPAVAPQITQLEDKGLRGSMVDVYGMAQGARYDEVDWSGDVFLDSFPNLIRAALGSADTKTGTVSPYSHAFSLQNNVLADNTTQPPAYTITVWDGYAYRQFLDSQLDSLSIKFSAAGLLTYSVKWKTMPYTVVSAPTQVVTTQIPVPAWDAAVTIGGSGVTRLVDGSIELKRSTKAIITANAARTPYRLWAGPLSISGKLTLVREDDTDINWFINNTQPTLDVKWSDPNNAANSIEFLMNQIAFKTGKPNYGKEWVEMDLDFEPIPNATNATAGGVSPVKVICTNSQSATF